MYFSGGEVGVDVPANGSKLHAVERVNEVSRQTHRPDWTTEADVVYVDEPR
jgi:hypothetical protein